MPRANRLFISGYVWHITHRCHRREFLLKFARDRQRWRYWLFEARKRFGLCVLNYTVTSNHIHLLVLDRGNGEIAKSMQLIAGRAAQEYNPSAMGCLWLSGDSELAAALPHHRSDCVDGFARNPCVDADVGIQHVAHQNASRG